MFCPAVTVGHRTFTTLCRGASQLSDTRNLTTPGPVPTAPRSVLIHDASGSAVHVHPGCVAMVAVIVYDTDIHGVNSTGVTEYSQTGAGGVSPACVIVNVRLPTVMVPVRLGELPVSLDASTRRRRFPCRCFPT